MAVSWQLSAGIGHGGTHWCKRVSVRRGAIVACRGDIPIVLTSGFFNCEDESAAALLGIRQLLNKPYTLEMLTVALNQARA